MFKTFMVTVVLIIACMFRAGGDQAPVIYNYEGIAFTPQGKPVASSTLLLRIMVKSTKSRGSIVYAETQSISTNPDGLFFVHIGIGKVIGGSMSMVGSDSRFFQIGMVSIGESSQALGQLQFKCIKCRLSNERYLPRRVEEKG